jgi:hypothetical protein
LSIKVSSVIRTLSAAHIKGKMSKLPINVFIIICPCLFSIDHCIVCPLIYGFWLPLWHFQTFLNSIYYFIHIFYLNVYYVDAIIVFIGDIIMCFTSDWQINLRIRVTNWPNIFVDQGQFSDSDFISGTHQRENVQIADKCFYFTGWNISIFIFDYSMSFI